MEAYRDTRLFTHNGVDITEVEVYKFSGGRAVSDGSVVRISVGGDKASVCHSKSLVCDVIRGEDNRGIGVGVHFILQSGERVA